MIDVAEICICPAQLPLEQWEMQEAMDIQEQDQERRGTTRHWWALKIMASGEDEDDTAGERTLEPTGEVTNSESEGDLILESKNSSSVWATDFFLSFLTFTIQSDNVGKRGDGREKKQRGWLWPGGVLALLMRHVHFVGFFFSRQTRQKGRA